MKRILLSLLLLCAGAGMVQAAPVSAAVAKQAALNFLKANGAKAEEAVVADITAQTPFQHLYIFEVKQGGGNGFVIIAGDDNSEPVLAYSLDGDFPTEAMPAHVRDWIKLYDRAVLYNSLTPRSKDASTAWEQLLAGATPSASKEVIGPLLTTQWNQSPYYNLYCPTDSATGKQPPCGCTATATGQIMKYYSYPATGYGSESYVHDTFGEQSADYGAATYNWSIMPEKLSDNSSDEEVQAVAQVLYHVGVAVHMNYALGGSGGKTASYGYGGDPSSENAFKYNFRYSPYVWTAFRDDYNDDDWSALMLNEVSNGRPVLYAGYDEVQSGHAFVLDGYNTANKCFHVNWGWGGSYDGYFVITKLNPGPPNNKYHFNLFATATIGIEPYEGFDPASTTTVTTAVEAIGGAAVSEGTVSGAGTYNFGDTIVMEATALNGHTRFVGWSDGCRYNPRSTVATGGAVSFTAVFAPVHVDTIGYYNSNNAMNRAINVPYGLGLDTVWGIRIEPEALWQHHDLTAVRYMGHKTATYTLTIYSGSDSPEEKLYSDTFCDSLPYDYTWYTYTLPTPLDVESSKSLWIVLKCTDVDTPGVFSIYGGNPNGMLSGEGLTPMGDAWKFSWMIDAIFVGDGNGIEEHGDGLEGITLYPNPATERVTLQGLTDDAVVEILDMNGSLCKSVKVGAGSGGRTTIATGDLRTGLYLVRITTGESSSTRKLMVQ